jgi:peroxiredoxin
MIQIGDPVGDVTFLRADGSPLRLADFAGKKTLLIFLRHLA